MKIIIRIILFFVVLSIALFLIALFFINTKTPRDLGIKYTQEDHISGRNKSQIAYEELPANTAPADSWQTYGTREVIAEFSSREITAIMNGKPGIYFPYKNVQVKFNADGSGEISGQLIKSKIPIYAATFDAPKAAVDLVMKFLPEDPVFYVKGRASLINNKIAIFEPMKFEIGRVPIPIAPILAYNDGIIKETLAMEVSELFGEISQVSNKKQLIIEFINSRIAVIEGFYAKNSSFAQDKLIFEGTLPEREATLR